MPYPLIPTFRALIASDLPLMGASGGTHGPGAVPDPGPSAGSIRYLREDGTWALPTGGGGGAGTVTSVDLSAPPEFSVSGTPITSAGMITLTKASQAQGTVYAAPSGAAGLPTFRALIAADLPAGTGTVTSVALTMPAEFTVGGSPISTSGTLAVTKANQSANLVYAGPTSGSAAPVFRALAASDIPALAYVSSVALSMPVEYTVTGSPVTGAGTLIVAKATQSANTHYAGPASGAAAAPTFRALAAADLPVMAASGASHAVGAVPDPGATAGTARYLREDATWGVPSGATAVWG